MMFVLSLLVILFGFCLYPSTSLKCYECTGHVPCGNGQVHQQVNCGGKCMVCRNQYDGGTIVRRCCWSNCGQVGASMYEGRYTYFCTDDLCNGDIADINLVEGGGGGGEEGSGYEFETTTKLSSSKFTTTTSKFVSISAAPASLSCHECTGHYSQCGVSQHTILRNCRMCMVYRNVYDANTVVRRCCTWGCGPSGSVTQYEGRQAYFCSSNLCNGIGAENALAGTRGRFIAGNAFPDN